MEKDAIKIIEELKRECNEVGIKYMMLASILISLKRIADCVEGHSEKLGIAEHIGAAVQDGIVNAARMG